MKQILLIATMLSLLTSLTLKSQTIQYLYDDAGNRKERSFSVGNESKGSFISEEKHEEAPEIKDETFIPMIIKIYPNPTRGILTIEVPQSAEESKEIQIKVTDMNGRTLIHEKNVPERKEISLESQPDGFYLLYIIREKLVSKWKVIKN